MADATNEQELDTVAFEEETPTSVKIVHGKKYIATLVNGENFFFGDLRFQRNVPRVVTAEQADHLAGKFIRQSLVGADEGAKAFTRKRFRITAAPAGAVVAQPEPVRHRHRVVAE